MDSDKALPVALHCCAAAARTYEWASSHWLRYVEREDPNRLVPSTVQKLCAVRLGSSVLE
eukprot:5824129-Amphidinium_carterae.2